MKLTISLRRAMKVFLGGTCNDSTWRERLIPMLNIDFFNPVVPNWTPECMEEERRQREICDYNLYVITPKMTGVFSIAEVVCDSIKRSSKTVFCALRSDDGAEFSEAQWKSLQQVRRMIDEHCAKTCDSLEDVAAFLNGV